MGQSIGDQICVLAHDVNVCVVATLPKSLPSTHLLWFLELFSKWAALLSKMWSCNSCSRGVQASCCVCAPQPKPIAITCFAKSFTEQTNLLFQPHVEWSWMELSGVELSSVELSRSELNCAELNWLCWMELNWIEFSWGESVELSWIELGWIQLNSVEPSRVALRRIELGWVYLNWIELTSIEVHRVESISLEWSWIELGWDDLNRAASNWTNQVVNVHFWVMHNPFKEKHTSRPVARLHYTGGAQRHPCDDQQDQDSCSLHQA